MSNENNHLLLIAGKSTTGKSLSLKGLANPSGVVYLNCENGKRLPFKHQFKQNFTIPDPFQVYQAITEVEKDPDVHTIVIDTLTYTMDMFELKYVLTATNTMKAWSDYSQFMKMLMFEHVAKSTKNIIFLADTSDIFNEKEMVNDVMVKVKGSLMNQGVESYFTSIVSTKKLPLSFFPPELIDSDMFNITDEEKFLEYKYVYQTRLTKDTVTERIRNPSDMWDLSETFIDNNAQYVIDRLHEYYS